MLKVFPLTLLLLSTISLGQTFGSSELEERFDSTDYEDIITYTPPITTDNMQYWSDINDIVNCGSGTGMFGDRYGEAVTLEWGNTCLILFGTSFDTLYQVLKDARTLKRKVVIYYDIQGGGIGNWKVLIVGVKVLGPEPE